MKYICVGLSVFLNYPYILPPSNTPDNREYLQRTHNENLQVALKKAYIFTCTDILPVHQTPLNAV